MPGSETLIAFAAVSVGIVLAPGPANIFLLAHGIGQGRRSALAAVAGIESAAIVRLAIVATGLSALIVSSPVAFAAVRWAGIGYLVYLGVQAWLSCGTVRGPAVDTGRVPVLLSARKGFVVGISNPSMVIFYLALFPQFIEPARGSEFIQILVLGGIMWVIGTIWDTGFAVASGSIGTWLQRRPGSQLAAHRLEGLVYLALAAWAAAMTLR